MPAAIVRAIYTCGILATGHNHGAAFQSLPKEYQEGNDFLIGSYDPSTRRFLADTGESRYQKTVILMRHGDVVDGNDPSLSVIGTKQVCDQIQRLSESVPDLHDFTIYVSPTNRALETAHLFWSDRHVEVKVIPEIADDPETIIQSDPNQKFTHFRWQKPQNSNLGSLVDTLVENSLIISHQPVLAAIAAILGVPPIESLPHAGILVFQHNQFRKV